MNTKKNREVSFLVNGSVFHLQKSNVSIRKVVALIHDFAGILKEFFREEKILNLKMTQIN